MKNVTNEISNPFGMRPPCSEQCISGSDRTAVFGYGDANADFHIIGDHPGKHGGGTTGIPFTGSRTGERIIDVLTETGLVDDTRSDSIRPTNSFLSYIYCCCVAPNSAPSREDYNQFERFFDAELRAIAADVLIPVGNRPTMHVLREYTNQYSRVSHAMTDLHGQELRGRGFLVVPLSDPSTWSDNEYDTAVDALKEVLTRDYKQMVDLGRFLPHGDPYFVR